MEVVKGDCGGIWILVDGKVLFYVSPTGEFVVPGDVIAMGDIPPPPKKET